MSLQGQLSLKIEKILEKFKEVFLFLLFGDI